MIDISIPARKFKNARPPKTHRALETELRANETLCGLKIRYNNRNGEYLSVATMKRLRVKVDGDVGDFDCVNCRNTWLSITSGD